MNEIERIREQAARAFEGGAWHGPALMEVISDLDAVSAATCPAGGAHSILEIVLHSAAWKRAIRRTLIERVPTRVSPQENWPKLAGADFAAAWREAVVELKFEHSEFLKAIEGIAPDQLDEKAPDGRFSVYTGLHGIIQHDLYHAGQIALLRRQMGQPLASAS